MLVLLVSPQHFPWSVQEARTQRTQSPKAETLLGAERLSEQMQDPNPILVRESQWG